MVLRRGQVTPGVKVQVWRGGYLQGLVSWLDLATGRYGQYGHGRDAGRGVVVNLGQQYENQADEIVLLCDNISVAEHWRALVGASSLVRVVGPAENARVVRASLR